MKPIAVVCLCTLILCGCSQREQAQLIVDVQQQTQLVAEDNRAAQEAIAAENIPAAVAILQQQAQTIATVRQAVDVSAQGLIDGYRAEWFTAFDQPTPPLPIEQARENRPAADSATVQQAAVAAQEVKANAGQRAVVAQTASAAVHAVSGDWTRLAVEVVGGAAAVWAAAQQRRKRIESEDAHDADKDLLGKVVTAVDTAKADMAPDAVNILHGAMRSLMTTGDKDRVKELRA